METPTSFGYWVRRRRKALDLTQGELARRVGCAEVTIQKIEADERRPSRQIAERLADILALDPDDRPAFLKVARSELVADQLAIATQPAEQRADIAQTTATLPSGTVTFLFTDIESSTQLWETHGEAMRTALARHDTLLRSAIVAHAGAVFKTLGDGICAAFARAPAALDAALAAQRIIQGEDWGTIGPVRVRMALHTGTATPQVSDYIGLPLNRVVRLLDVGHGGQVLLSLVTAELVREALPPDATLRDLGEHRLKDLSHPERIFQLVVPDLPSDFPPLQTLDAQPAKLPVQPTALIGREQEVAVACALMQRADVRLLTFTGPGGVGKTRLALQVAADLLDNFADGVWLVNLAPASDPGLVASIIAQTLTVREVGGRPLLTCLKDYLREKQLLLLLDNFEQVIDAAPLVAELLAVGAHLKILVTSREVLRLRGEKIFPVRPLALPDLNQLPLLSVLVQYPAVNLFIQRALDVKHDFLVTEENAPAVAEICVRLDGLPLAIELAAAWGKLFPPSALLVRLEQRLSMLTGGPRGVPARQQALRDTIAWSYNLLDTAEQTLFRRLAVFVGGCTLEAAEAVCNCSGDLGVDVLNGLATLVDQSLLQQEIGPDGAARFMILETIREYALERLEELGELSQTRERHLAYYLVLVEQANGQREGKALEQWCKRLVAELDNFRSARLWSRTIENGAEADLRLIGALWWFYQIMGYISEARAWLEASLERRNTIAPAVQALALLGLGGLLTEAGHYQKATNLYRESLTLYQDIGDHDSVARLQHYLGYVARLQGLYEQARFYQEESLTYYRKAGKIKDAIWSLLMLGEVFADQGEGRQAITCFHEALAYSQKLEDKEGHAWAVVGLGRIAHRQGDDERAAALYQEGLGLFHDLKYRYGIAEVLADLGNVGCIQGKGEDAMEYYRESLALWQEMIRGGHYVYESLQGMAGVAWIQGKAERAARLFGAVEHLRELSGTPIAPIDRAGYDRFVDATRAQLDKETFAAAWATGQAMTLDQAIAEALDC